MALGIRGWIGVMVAAVAATAPECAWAQTVAPQQQPKMTLVEPPAPLLPQRLAGLYAQSITHADSDMIDATLSSNASEAFDPKTCLMVLPNGVAVPPHPISLAAEYCGQTLKEDGLRRLSDGRYYLSGTAGATADVWVFEFGDATGAYSAYTFYRTLLKAERISVRQSAKSTDETSSDADGTLIWSGTTVVRVSGHLGKEPLTALTASLPKASGRRALAPLLPTMLPTESGAKLDSASVRYALGPVGYKAMGGVLPPDRMGWDKSLEVATATYAGKGGKGMLTLLLYPTPQIAGDRGRAIEKVVNEHHAELGTVKMRRVGPLVGVTSGSLTDDQAEALVQALKLNEIVTFDQKMPLEFHAEVRKTATLLQSIAIFTGVLILAAVVIAVFLGGARAGIRVLRGKSAASEPEFLTIDLRDKPKALFVPPDDKSGGSGD